MKTCLIYLLLTAACLGAGCKKAFFREEPAKDPEAIFNHIWTKFNEDYGPFSERGVDWKQQYNRFAPRVNPGMSDQELFQVISDMLATLNDGHVNLSIAGTDTFNANFLRNNKVDDALFSIELIKNNYLEPGYKKLDDNGFVYGKLKGQDIGYIYFDYVAGNFLVMEEFIEKFKDSKGFIIDLRHNSGGDFTFCYSEIGRFTDQERLVFRSRTKNGPGTNDFTPWYDWSIKPKGSYVNKPIVVLTDRFTISAGERSVMAFKTLPNVTIIGDTTCGAHSTMVGGELANGWNYTIATQNTQFRDGKSYEGVGIAPDILFKNTLSDMQAGNDKTLEKAIAEF